MSDDLFSIKNEFYLGNYMGAINEAQSGDLELSTPNDERDRDVIVRAQYPPLLSLPQKRYVSPNHISLRTDKNAYKHVF